MKTSTALFSLFAGLLVFAFNLVCNAPIARACTIAMPTPPPTFWIEDHGLEGPKRAFWVGVEVDLFSSGSPMGCVCGISATTVPPLSYEVVDAGLSVTNTLTKDTVFLSEFSFTANAITSAGLGTGFGGTWDGFSADVSSITPPALGANEVFKLWFKILLDPSDVGYVTNLRMGGGSGGLGTGNPNFTGPHPVQEMFAVDPQITFVPEPARVLLSLLGLGAIALRRRRRRV